VSRNSSSGSLALSKLANLVDRAAGAADGITGEHVAPDFRSTLGAVVEDPLALSLETVRPIFTANKDLTKAVAQLHQ
jgi:hypothetical protein